MSADGRTGNAKVLGGVCAAIANGTGFPVAVARLAFVAVPLALSAAGAPNAGAAVIVAYFVMWFLKSRSAGDVGAGVRPAETYSPSPSSPPTAPSPEPAPGSGAPHKSPEPDELDASRPHLRELYEYLWGAPETPPAVYSTWAHGFRLDGLPITRTPDKGIANHYIVRMPYGRVFIWPGWLVFLTESHNRQGEIPPATRIWSVLLDYVREYRRFASFVRLGTWTYGRLTKEQRDRLRRALANPNSFIVPISTVEHVWQERWMMSPRLHFRAEGREFVLAPNGTLELGPSYWRVLAGMWGLWQPKLHQQLRAGGAKEDS